MAKTGLSKPANSNTQTPSSSTTIAKSTNSTHFPKNVKTIADQINYNKMALQKVAGDHNKSIFDFYDKPTTKRPLFADLCGVFSVIVNGWNCCLDEGEHLKLRKRLSKKDDDIVAVRHSTWDSAVYQICYSNGIVHDVCDIYIVITKSDSTTFPKMFVQRYGPYNIFMSQSDTRHSAGVAQDMANNWQTSKYTNKEKCQIVAPEELWDELGCH